MACNIRIISCGGVQLRSDDWYKTNDPVRYQQILVERRYKYKHIKNLDVVTCECGREVQYRSLVKHYSSKSHKNIIKQL